MDILTGNECTPLNVDKLQRAFERLQRKVKLEVVQKFEQFLKGQFHFSGEDELPLIKIE